MFNSFVSLARTVCVSTIFASVATVAAAQDVNITQDMPYFEFDNGKRFMVIERNQDQNAVVDPSFAKTSRACPPFCIHPMSAAPGVETYGELELLDFIRDHVEPGTGYLVDARLSDWYAAGTIPGSVNLPFTLFQSGADNPFRDGILQLLGGVRTGSGTGWNFDDAKHLALFCNGPWCDQSPQAIENLIAAGYPAEKLKYYRGGMQSWLMLGLTVEIPNEGTEG
ncbi:rhodanese-like domain-containing protein [Halovulum dunhuangense]|uniref:Rhodanese-like domain-containing protein n=1 Tax=Halovulum dunhuangense TaxID=1505036 RepID=A0A849L3M6_9RHOB|nr:rhodanese-like domain-containing protein [Halovulum dunhuangense]NNU80853.1 rhodanese-like domain-containing protein [Halovulum dunhuangense]